MPPNHEKPQNKKGSYFRNYLIQRAENGTQTRDPQLGRLVLYRLSYFRKCIVPHTSRTHYAFSIRNGRHKQTLSFLLIKKVFTLQNQTSDDKSFF